MAGVTRERLQGVVAVAPGRRLSFVSFGHSDGPVVIWMHGTPGAATQIPEDARARAERDGLRIVGIDRPGVGHSTPHLYPDVAAFGDDLARFLDALDIDTCAIVGLSGGGPYALAAAARLPERISAVGILGGVAPSVGADAAPGGAVAWAKYVRRVLTVGRVAMGLGLAGLIRATTPLGDPAIRLYAHFSPEGDRELLNRPDFKQIFLEDLTRRGRRQFSAVLADIILFSRDWGFTLDDVGAPVHWWHGVADNIVPIAHGKHVVARLADATFHPVAGGGHLAGFGVAHEVLDAVIGRATRPDS